MQVNGVNLCRASQEGETRSASRKYLLDFCCQEKTPDSNVKISIHLLSKNLLANV